VNDAGVKKRGQSADREVVRVPFEIAVLDRHETTPVRFCLSGKPKKRYLVVPRLECKLSPTLPEYER